MFSHSPGQKITDVSLAITGVCTYRVLLLFSQLDKRVQPKRHIIRFTCNSYYVPYEFYLLSDMLQYLVSKCWALTVVYSLSHLALSSCYETNSVARFMYVNYAIFRMQFRFGTFFLSNYFLSSSYAKTTSS